MDEIKYDVFISYSTVDKMMAEGVCGYLESHRVRCFVAYRDIPKGTDWAQAIPNALHGSRMMLAVFSKAFNLSEQTDRELHIAAKLKIPILTFRITDDNFGGAKEYFLAKSNWIDAFPEPERQFGELLRSVALLLDMKNLMPHGGTAQPVQPAAQLSAAEATCAEAKRLLYNDKEHRDAMKAYYLLGKAAREGLPEAEYQMGLCLWNAWGTSLSWQQARQWLTSAADHGHPKAMLWLAKMHHYAIGGEQNTMQALTLYTAAAEAGDGCAAKTLGKVYHTGELGVVDEERSREWYARAFEQLQQQAFEHDDTDAMVALADSYLDGEGVDRNYELCFEWASRAAAMFNSKAINLLALCYDDGFGVAKDVEKSREMKRQAADLDCRMAQNNMAGLCSELGLADEERSYRMKAANGGNAMALGVLAAVYDSGLDPYPLDKRQAEMWYAKAIEAGSLDAIYNYGVRLENDDNATDDDRAHATEYYKRAAMLDYYPAFVALGNQYYAGSGVQESDEEAERWYRKYLDVYERMVAENLTIVWYPSGQGNLTGMSFDDEFEHDMLVRVCQNLVWIYRNSSTVTHDEIEARRLEQILAKLNNTLEDSPASVPQDLKAQDNKVEEFGKFNKDNFEKNNP